MSELLGELRSAINMYQTPKVDQIARIFSIINKSFYDRKDLDEDDMTYLLSWAKKIRIDRFAKCFSIDNMPFTFQERRLSSPKWFGITLEDYYYESFGVSPPKPDAVSFCGVHLCTITSDRSVFHEELAKVSALVSIAIEDVTSLDKVSFHYSLKASSQFRYTKDDESSDDRFKSSRMSLDNFAIIAPPKGGGDALLYYCSFLDLIDDATLDQVITAVVKSRSSHAQGH